MTRKPIVKVIDMASAAVRQAAPPALRVHQRAVATQRLGDDPGDLFDAFLGAFHFALHDSRAYRFNVMPYGKNPDSFDLYRLVFRQPNELTPPLDYAEVLLETFTAICGPSFHRTPDLAPLTGLEDDRDIGYLVLCSPKAAFVAPIRQIMTFDEPREPIDWLRPKHILALDGLFPVRDPIPANYQAIDKLISAFDPRIDRDAVLAAPLTVSAPFSPAELEQALRIAATLDYQASLRGFKRTDSAALVYRPALPIAHAEHTWSFNFNGKAARAPLPRAQTLIARTLGIFKPVCGGTPYRSALNPRRLSGLACDPAERSIAIAPVPLSYGTSRQRCQDALALAGFFRTAGVAVPAVLQSAMVPPLVAAIAPATLRADLLACFATKPRDAEILFAYLGIAGPAQNFALCSALFGIDATRISHIVDNCRRHLRRNHFRFVAHVSARLQIALMQSSHPLNLADLAELDPYFRDIVDPGFAVPWLLDLYESEILSRAIVSSSDEWNAHRTVLHFSHASYLADIKPSDWDFVWPHLKRLADKAAAQRLPVARLHKQFRQEMSSRSVDCDAICDITWKELTTRIRIVYDPRRKCNIAVPQMPSSVTATSRL